MGLIRDGVSFTKGFVAGALTTHYKDAIIQTVKEKATDLAPIALEVVKRSAQLYLRRKQ